MKETVREARTIILDKNGKELPVPEGTDPHVAAKPQAEGQKSEARSQRSEISKEEKPKID